MEKALRRYLQTDRGQSPIRASLFELLTETGRSPEEDQLRNELSKIMRASDGGKDIILMKPRTLKAFIEDEEGRKEPTKCSIFKCSFTVLGDD